MDTKICLNYYSQISSAIFICSSPRALAYMAVVSYWRGPSISVADENKLPLRDFKSVVKLLTIFKYF